MSGLFVFYYIYICVCVCVCCSLLILFFRLFPVTMRSLVHLMLLTVLVVCMFPYIDNANNPDSMLQELTESRLRQKRFLDDILNNIVDKFLDNLNSLIGQLSGEAKENFVRKMYTAIKDYASEGKETFIRKLKLAVEELPGALSHVVDTLIPTFVDFIWSDKGVKPGFLKLRQIIFSEADKMGISGELGHLELVLSQDSLTLD